MSYLENLKHGHGNTALVSIYIDGLTLLAVIVWTWTMLDGFQQPNQIAKFTIKYNTNQLFKLKSYKMYPNKFKVKFCGIKFFYVVAEFGSIPGMFSLYTGFLVFRTFRYIEHDTTKSVNLLKCAVQHII